MSDETVYRVVVDLSTRGDLAGALGQAGSGSKNLAGALGQAKSHARELGSAIHDFGAHVASSIGSVVDRVESMVTSFAKIAAIGALGLIAHDTITLNQELERTQISLGAIFTSQGVTGDITQGMQLATQMMGQMRKDAAALPGEFKDLRGIFTNIANPGLMSGASPAALEHFSAKTMAVAGALNMSFEQAGREMGMLLMGRAGSHNVLGMQLAGLGGDTAKKFNEMTAPERFAFVSKELDKWAPAIDAFSKSFTGVSTTFMDHLRMFREAATKPLFDRLTHDLGLANAWLDHNKASVDAFAADVGGKLVAAWDFVGSKISYVANHIDQIHAGFDKLFSEETLHKAERLGAALLLSKGARAFGPDIFRIGGAAASLLGGGGGAGAAGSTGAAGMTSGLLEGLFGAGGLAGAAASAGVLTVALLALYGAFDAATDSTNKHHASVMASLQSMGASMDELGHAASAALEAVRPLADELGDGLASGAASALHEVASLAEDLSTLAGAASSAAGSISGLISSLSSSIKGYFDKDTRDAVGGAVDSVKNAFVHGVLPMIPGIGPAIAVGNVLHGVAGVIRGSGDNGPTVTRSFDDGLARGAAIAGAMVPETAKSVPAGGGGGGGGQHIQKVEIVVSGNDDPSRVARKVFEQLAELRRNPNASRNTINWSARR